MVGCLAPGLLPKLTVVPKEIDPYVPGVFVENPSGAAPDAQVPSAKADALQAVPWSMPLSKYFHVAPLPNNVVSAAKLEEQAEANIRHKKGLREDMGSIMVKSFSCIWMG